MTIVFCDVIQLNGHDEQRILPTRRRTHAGSLGLDQAAPSNCLDFVPSGAYVARGCNWGMGTEASEAPSKSDRADSLAYLVAVVLTS